MSLHDYRVSQEIGAKDYPFYALIMAAFRQADTYNLQKLRCAFFATWLEFKERYHAPGGLLEGEEVSEESLPETIMGMKVVVSDACPNAWNLVLGRFNEYDRREELDGA